MSPPSSKSSVSSSSCDVFGWRDWKPPICSRLPLFLRGAMPSASRASSSPLRSRMSSRTRALGCRLTIAVPVICASSSKTKLTMGTPASPTRPSSWRSVASSNVEPSRSVTSTMLESALGRIPRTSMASSVGSVLSIASNAAVPRTKSLRHRSPRASEMPEENEAIDVARRPSKPRVKRPSKPRVIWSKSVSTPTPSGSKAGSPIVAAILVRGSRSPMGVSGPKESPEAKLAPSEATPPRVGSPGPTSPNSRRNCISSASVSSPCGSPSKFTGRGPKSPNPPREMPDVMLAIDATCVPSPW
mmetsp:Transcript_1726/g.4422  ORF Transcript_1726/g.4422 Transcript_1726/m.4422 type:complete len:301 (+) Transcript_1726:8517-9419(+)